MLLMLRYDISFLFGFTPFLRLLGLRPTEDFLFLQNLLIELRLHENKEGRKVKDVKGGKEHIGK